MRVNDPAYVERQYASEAGLLARRALYDETTGPDARDVAFAAVAETRPGRVLEVGCGPGEMSERIGSELGAHVSALDISPRMVELARQRGVDAHVGDVQTMPFSSAAFDCVLAAWVLQHVPDLELAISEIARVSRPGGRLVAATNGADHLQEVADLVGIGLIVFSFRAENGAAILSRHFDRVERRDAGGTVTIRDPELLRAYLRSSERLAPGAERVPEFSEPLVARRRNVVFVAEKAV